MTMVEPFVSDRANHRRELPRPAGIMHGRAVAQVVPASYKQIDYWLTNYDFGLATPPNPGSGHPREIPASALPRLFVFADLVNLGMRADVVAGWSHEARLRARGVLTKVRRYWTEYR